MNERIKKLAKHEQVDACYIPRYDMWQMDSESLEKFAELIVRECAPFVGDKDSQKVYQMLKHFGVKE